MPGRTRPLRVLVVEDEPALRELVRVHLELEGVEASTCEDATGVTPELLEWCDVVLTDWRMGAGGGREVVRRAKTRDPALPVVIWTAWKHSVPEDRCGAELLLEKPVSMARAILEMKELVHRGR